jgi:release factor glutamine methyltransferase
MQAMVNRRVQGEPIQYIVGHTDFMGYQILVGPAVLIPRPETEELVAVAVDSIPRGNRTNVLDIGTGSGCISIAIARLRPDAHVTAIDISSEAIDLARHNARLNKVDIDFVCIDGMAVGVAERLGIAQFDLVVSNPPYIGIGEREGLQKEVLFEPEVALFSGKDGTEMFTRSLVNVSAVLRDGGNVFFEVHSERADIFARILQEAPFENVELITDAQGRSRILRGRRCAKTKSGDL